LRRHRAPRRLLLARRTIMNNQDMIIRILLAIIFPPLAVYDKGCGTILLILLLTCLGWLPGTVVALLICLNHKG